MKIWINEHEFTEVSDHTTLITEVASRARSTESVDGILPDPDPVLKKLGKDITVYRELLSDAHVWSVCESRKSGTLSCKWEVREALEGKTDRRALELCRDVMKQLKPRGIINSMLDAPFFGMSPIEIIWESIEGKWQPVRADGKPPEWFKFDSENNLRFISQESGEEGEELSGYKFLVPRHHANYQNPYGERLLARAFWPVAFKRGGFKFWSLFTQKFGMPWVIGKVPKSTNQTERKKLLSRLTAMVQDAVAVINDDESIEITESAGKAASGQIYENLIKASNREISKAVLGQTLSTEIDKGGSYAATQSHMSVREDLVASDKEMVTDNFNLLFSWITELNFSGATPPEFAFIQDEDVQKERAERDEVLNNQGVRFTKNYYIRTYNLEQDDFELTENSNGASGEFAESQTQKFTPAQQAIEDLADKAVKEAANALEANEQKILEAVQSSDSYEEAIQKLLEVYPQMDMDDLEDLMERCFINAELFGKMQVREEIHDA